MKGDDGTWQALRGAWVDFSGLRDCPAGGGEYGGGVAEPVAQIPKESIEQVLGATDIVELIGTYLPLKRAGCLLYTSDAADE